MVKRDKKGENRYAYKGRKKFNCIYNNLHNNNCDINYEYSSKQNDGRYYIYSNICIYIFEIPIFIYI